jgi:hypothetical protein
MQHLAGELVRPRPMRYAGGALVSNGDDDLAHVDNAGRGCQSPTGPLPLDARHLGFHPKLDAVLLGVPDQGARRRRRGSGTSAFSWGTAGLADARTVCRCSASAGRSDLATRPHLIGPVDQQRTQAAVAHTERHRDTGRARTDYGYVVLAHTRLQRSIAPDRSDRLARASRRRSFSKAAAKIGFVADSQASASYSQANAHCMVF